MSSETITEPDLVVRPGSVTIIGFLFIVLGALDLIFRIKNGFLDQTATYGNDGSYIGSGVRFQLLWLVLYAIGAGILRRGKFARFMGSVVGVIAGIIPGVIIIYLLYFSSAKEYFNRKECPKCHNEKWKNMGLTFSKQKCKNCGHIVHITDS